MLFEEQIVVAFAAGHPFCALEHVTFEQLAEEALIAYREGSSELRRRLEWAMGDHGVRPRNVFLCTEMAAVRGLASRGLGAAVLPESIAQMEGEPIESARSAEPLTWPVTIVWRAPRRQPPAAKAFLALALDGVQQPARRASPRPGRPAPEQHARQGEDATSSAAAPRHGLHRVRPGRRTQQQAAERLDDRRDRLVRGEAVDPGGIVAIGTKALLG